MTRYIDADLYKMQNAEILDCEIDHPEYQDTLRELIDDAPTADVVEVVRCGSCEWWKCNPNTTKYGVCKKASYDDFEVVMESDDFCSYGERRE